VAPALGEVSKRAQGLRQPRPGPDLHVCVSGDLKLSINGQGESVS
jgi:hypothetical protein